LNFELRVALYLASFDIDLADSFLDRFVEKCERVSVFPNMGKPYENLAPRLRGFLVDDYIAFYYPRDDGIEIVYVLSGYRQFERFFSD